jgi:hypothetical protein
MLTIVLPFTLPRCRGPTLIGADLGDGAA